MTNDSTTDQAAANTRAARDVDPSVAEEGASCRICPDIPEPTRVDLILRGLGFCGHYLHFHGGGRSGRDPILCLLHNVGGSMSQQEMGSRFELKPGSLSEILAKIETAGLIERTRGAHDRRQLFVHLTEAGEREAQRALKTRKQFRERAFSNLSDEEQDELLALLQKIRSRWEELDA